jgi:DNA-binding CsgD family transcriptional regulator
MHTKLNESRRAIMNFDKLFEYCPAPMLITNTEGIILESNARTRELAGFKNKKEGTFVHYSEQPCDISAFSEDFIIQDNLAINSPVPIQFLSMYRFSDSKFHIHFGNKSKTEDGMVLTSMFEISNYTNPLLIELLCLHSTVSLFDKNRGFTYIFQGNDQIKNIFSKKELQCIRYLCRSFSIKLIANEMCLSPRTVEGYLDNIKNKLGVNSKHEIVTHCIKHKLLSFEDLFLN